MAQATVQHTPPRLGDHFAQAHRTAVNLDPASADLLSRVYSAVVDPADDADFRAARRRLDDALDLIDAIDDDAPPHADSPYPAFVADAIYAVLLRDRGLITAADFRLLTAPWSTARLPIPDAITGDDEADPLASVWAMTSDRIADQLLLSAWGTDTYAATMLLTGFNHCELLAYRSIRAAVERRHDGSLYLDWASLKTELTHGVTRAEQPAIEDELTPEAIDALYLAIDLGPDGDQTDLIKSMSGSNAEVLIRALAQASGLTALLDPTWDGATSLNPGDRLRPRAGDPGE